MLPNYFRKQDHADGLGEFYVPDSQVWKSVKIDFPSSIQNIAENILSILQLLDTVSQEGSLSPRSGRLGDDALSFGIRHVDHDHGRKDGMKASDDMAFDDLGCDVCKKCLLLHLEHARR